MHPRAVELLACPACSGSLSLSSTTSEWDEHVMEGSLQCFSCERRWPIHRGIPRLIFEATDAASLTADRFAVEWSMFSEIRDYHRRQFIDWIDPLTPADLAGQVVLEGGCGKGRHSRLLGEWAADVVSIDLGAAVEVAFANTKDLPNVHIVQTDIVRPGVAATFDTSISVGVLHHLPDPENGFRSLVDRTRPAGRVVTWTYGRENNGWIVHLVDPLRKALTSRLPARALRFISAPIGLAIWGLAKLVALSKFLRERLPYSAYLSYIGSFPSHEVKVIVYDQLAPPISHYLPRPEIERWYREAGLEQVMLTWHNRNSWRATGVKRPANQ